MSAEHREYGTSNTLRLSSSWKDVVLTDLHHSAEGHKVNDMTLIPYSG